MFGWGGALINLRRSLGLLLIAENRYLFFCIFQYSTSTWSSGEIVPWCNWWWSDCWASLCTYAPQARYAENDQGMQIDSSGYSLKPISNCLDPKLVWNQMYIGNSFNSKLIFTRSTSTEGDRVYKLKICLSVCLFVCHHFKISNIGPLCHTRITPDPTYHILLDTAVSAGLGQVAKYM